MGYFPSPRFRTERGEVLADPRVVTVQGAGAEGETLEGHDWPSCATRRGAGWRAGRQAGSTCSRGAGRLRG